MEPKYMKGDVVFHIDALEAGRQGEVVKVLAEDDVREEYVVFSNIWESGDVNESNLTGVHYWYSIQWYDDTTTGLVREDWLTLAHCL